MVRRFLDRVLHDRRGDTAGWVLVVFYGAPVLLVGGGVAAAIVYVIRKVQHG